MQLRINLLTNSQGHTCTLKPKMSKWLGQATSKLAYKYRFLEMKKLILDTPFLIFVAEAAYASQIVACPCFTK